MRGLTFALIAALLVAPLTAADDHWEDLAEEAREAREEAGTEWEYEVSVSATEASVEMSSESEISERSISFEYSRDDASIEFEYEAETVSLEAEAAMEVQFHQLFEFEDDNGNGRYDDGETIVGGFNLNDGAEESIATDFDDASWNAIQRSSVTSDDGVQGDRFSSTADLNGGSLTFDFYVFGDEASLGEASVEATELKLNITIENYPFQSDTSILGLLLESETEAELEGGGGDSDEEGVEANVGVESLVFAWKDFADVDGARTDVHTTYLDSESEQSSTEYENEQLMVLTYARGDSIVHDPTMGVVGFVATVLGLPAPGLVLAALGVVGAALVARRTA